jgi:hypothetical protein
MRTLRALTVTVAALSLAAAPGVAAAGPSANDALVFRSANGKLRVFDAVTGPLRTLPAGVLSADGESLLSAQVRAGQTLVRRIETRTGRVLAHRLIPGAWGFQKAAEDGTLVAGGEGLAPIALVAANRANGYHGSARTTRIALLARSLQGPLKVVTLDGNFGVDALAPDGTRLYVIEHLGGEHYTVRGYDLVKRKLSVPIIDKREPNEKMQGLPLARASNADGSWELTLYRRPSGVPFVHALMTTSLAAFCIDLPASARIDPSQPSSWGVATRGDEMYLANAQTGWIGVIGIGSIDFSRLKVLRSTSLGALATATSTRPLAVSGDGTTLYLARADGIIPLASGTLTPGTALTTRAFGSLALGTDGSRLYASGGGSTTTLDTKTGAAGATLRTAAGLTLVGVARP